jgi:hypothetical protein
MPPGFEQAAHTLGVTAEQLMDALGGAAQRPDFAAAAAKPGVSEDTLRAALPSPPQHSR